MRRVNAENMKPGMVLARPIIDERGNILLRDGVELHEDLIRSIRKKGFQAVFIQEAEGVPEVPMDDDLDPELRVTALTALNETFSEVQTVADDLREETFESVQRRMNSNVIRTLVSDTGPFARLDEAVFSIIDAILDLEILTGLTSIRSVDSYLLNHSIDVCVISIMIGKTIGLDSQQMKQTAKGAIIHDIGKIFVNMKQLDQESQIRQHTLLGYELLRQGYDMIVPHVALEHHEHQDGSGLPRGLHGSNTIRRKRKGDDPVLTLAGEIVALADTYDNLVSGSAQRVAISPENALQTIQQRQGTHLNREIVTAFRRVIPVYPMGTQVIIRSGEYRNFRGIVSQVNSDAPDRPTIVLYKDNRGNPITSIEINTLSEPKLEIRSVSLD